MKDPMTLLKEDHKTVKAALKELLESEPGAEREQTFEQVRRDLTLHMRIEEELFYPLVQQMQGDEVEEEANVEHDLARTGLDTAQGLLSAPGFGAAIEMLLAGVTHHVKEEETEILPTLKEQMERDEWMALSESITEAKQAESAER